MIESLYVGCIRDIRQVRYHIGHKLALLRAIDFINKLYYTDITLNILRYTFKINLFSYCVTVYVCEFVCVCTSDII